MVTLKQVGYRSRRTENRLQAFKKWKTEGWKNLTTFVGIWCQIKCMNPFYLVLMAQAATGDVRYFLYIHFGVSQYL